LSLHGQNALIRQFGRNSSGAIAMVFAVCLPALVSIVAVATDYVMMSRIQTELQSAADAAALGGANEFSLSGSTDSQIKAVAKSFAFQNLFGSAKPSKDAGDGSVTVKVNVKRKSGEVEVGVEKQWTPVFLHLLSAEVTPIRVKAHAQFLNSGLTCVLGLAKLLPGGVNLSHNARLTADGCSVYSNTDTPLGLTVSNNAELRAKFICVVGGYVAVNARAIEPAPTTDCPPAEDPLASRSPPPIPGCKSLLPLVLLNREETLEPGRYCGGISILGNSKITLKKGDYIIENGVLLVSGTSTLQGESVSFYMRGLTSSFNFGRDTTIDLSAQEDGPLAGLLFFEDHDALPTNIHIISSNNARRLVGTIYVPRGTLSIDANAPVADRSAYTAFVVHSLILKEGPHVVLRSDYESTDVPVPQGLIGKRVILTE
jgi:Flp pilus assembly protein TadG